MTKHSNITSGVQRWTSVTQWYLQHRRVASASVPRQRTGANARRARKRPRLSGICRTERYKQLLFV